jgi:RNA polymerase sigma factor (sigma-70 family)
MQGQADDLIPTRASLLLRLKDWRDQASWQKFFDTYWELIYGVARRAGLNEVEAQDVVQETMLAVAKHLPGFTYSADGSFKAWLLNMTRWRIVDEIRKRPKADLAELVESHAEDAPTRTTDLYIDPTGNALDALWEAEWKDTLFKAAVASVKRRVEPRTYQLFDFYVNKDWPTEKVASTFDVHVEQVHLAKHRITEMLKAEVARLDREAV